MKIVKLIGLAGLVMLLVVMTIATELPGRTVKERQVRNDLSRPRYGLHKPGTIVQNEFAVHDKGLQWLMMANFGELSDPDDRPVDTTPWALHSSRRPAKLEYPGGSGTVFIFSGGLWVGAIKQGEKIVSTVTDGDDGTNEYGPVMGWLYQSKDDGAKEKDDDGDWNAASDDWDGNGRPSSDWDGPEIDSNGDGVFNYDPEPHIDEDPVGNMAADFIDNDFDGMIDANDPDFDGDKVPNSDDDDGDGLIDEDILARAGQEWTTAYVDTCEDCINAADPDGFTPLGIRVVQHSYQWAESFADDFIIFDFAVTNIGDTDLEQVWLATFFDFDIGHLTQVSNTRSEDDITFFIDSLGTAVGGDNDGDDGLLAAQYFGVRVLQTPMQNVTISYLNFGRLASADPNDNVEKYDLISSGERHDDQLADEDWRFIFSFGPLGTISPGETLPVTLAIVNGYDLDAIITNSRQALAMFNADFRGPAAPDAPNFTLEPMNHAVKIAWDDIAESSIDPISLEKEFEGYRIWRSFDGLNFTMIADFDLVNDLGFNKGLPGKNANGMYEFVDTGVPNLVQIMYAVTAYDNGDNGDGIYHPEQDRATGGVGELESSRGVERLQTVIAGSKPKSKLADVYVVPNPYVGSSEFERFGSFDADLNRSFPKAIKFVNLPAEARIQIFTLAGDLVQEIEHNNGSGIEAWNLRTRLNQEAVAGIYLYRIEANGEETIGKFIVVK